MVAVVFTRKASNAKVGPIPVTTSDRGTCPTGCPFKGNGCYAEAGPLGSIWRAMSAAGPNASFQNGRNTGKTMDWAGLLDAVRSLPEGQLWRHNQAGDLPHEGGTIQGAMVGALAVANRGRRGFTYTHHDMAVPSNRGIVSYANKAGFTVNLSANSPAEADKLAALEIGPVVTVLPEDVHGKADLHTPEGRRIVVCPATYRDDVTCASCGLCAVAKRKVVVGFPAHGASKKKAGAIARG